jgi:hypothetical protein
VAGVRDGGETGGAEVRGRALRQLGGEQVGLSVDDEGGHAEVTQAVGPVVALAAQARGDGGAGGAVAGRGRHQLDERGVGEPGREEGGGVGGVAGGVGLAERLGVEGGEHRVRCRVRGGQVRERCRVQLRQPAAGDPHRIDEDEAPHVGAVGGGGEHRDAAAPRVPEHVPARQAERLAQRRRSPASCSRRAARTPGGAALSPRPRWS